MAAAAAAAEDIEAEKVAENVVEIVEDGFVEAALWPVASVLLLMPQRRPADPDDTRPI